MHGATSVSFSPDGRYLAVSETDEISIYKLTGAPPSHRLMEAKNGALSLSSTAFSPLPPILAVQSIEFSEKVLDAEEDAELRIAVKNVGPGAAEELYVELSGGGKGISFPSRTKVSAIAPNQSRIVSIPVRGGTDLPTGSSRIDIRLVAPRFKVNIPGKRLTFATNKLRTPSLILAKFAVLENRSASPNGRIDVNEIIELKFAIQNVGDGPAENVSISAECVQDGVFALGVVDEAAKGPVKKHPRFSLIEPGKYVTVSYWFFISSEVAGDRLNFSITASERRNRFGFTEKKFAAVNKELPEEGFIREVRADSDPVYEQVTVEDIPDFKVDVETNLPKTAMSERNAIAAVIGNSNYRNAENVTWAARDAVWVRNYLIEVLGYREGNIFFIKNASKADFETYFGSERDHRGKLFNAVKPSKSDVFIYYSGHGAAGPDDRRGYFAPVDSDPDYISTGGYSVETFVRNISRLPAKSVTVVIDACFSGIAVDSSPMEVRIKNDFALLEKGLILTSSRLDQISTWYDEKKHGMFTYFFLKAIHDKNADTNQDGNLTFDEIHRYVADKTEGVPYYARRLHGVDQFPHMSGANRDRVFIRYRR